MAEETVNLPPVCIPAQVILSYFADYAPKTTNPRPIRQISQYDKILKENLEAAIPALIERIIGIQIAHSEEIPDEIQHTKERKPDALKRITDQTGETFILHLEFQVKNEPKMVHRMHTYCAILLEQYEIPVRQYVFYLGMAAPQMITELSMGDVSFRYNLISFQQLDYRIFLSSPVPEDILLAVLANFKPAESPVVLGRILDRLAETANGPLVLEKYRSQLRVLVQLRNLKPIFDDAMDNLTDFFKKENDIYYILGERNGEAKGEAKGEARKERLFVKNLVRQTDFSNEQIAALAGVSVDFVKKIRRSRAAD